MQAASSRLASIIRVIVSFRLYTAYARTEPDSLHRIEVLHRASARFLKLQIDLSTFGLNLDREEISALTRGEGKRRMGWVADITW